MNGVNMNFKRILLLGIVASSLLAQVPITVSNFPGVSADYNDLQTAIDASPQNSTIYVYASSESYGNINITKMVSLYGTGSFPDSPSPVRSTLGTVTFSQFQADSSHGSILSGFATGSISISEHLRNITIERNIGSTISLNYNLNVSIMNCRLNSNAYGTMINLNASTNTTILNCRIYRNYSSNSYDINIFSGGHALIANNYVYFRSESSDYATEYLFRGPNYTIENNIFDLSGYATWGDPNSSQITNNLSTLEAPIGQNFNSGSENIIGSATFTSTTWGDADYYALDFGSPGVGAGTDGTDLGIHGGSLGFGNAYMPPLPYVHKLLVPAVVPQNGTITIEIIGKSHN
jgi:hypothetical protein